MVVVVVDDDDMPRKRHDQWWPFAVHICDKVDKDGFIVYDEVYMQLQSPAIFCLESPNFAIHLHLQ